MDITPLRKFTVGEWIRAVERDGFRERKHRGSHHLYQHPDGRRLLIVYHNQHETFGPRTIRQILKSTGWDEGNLRELNLLS